MRNNTPKIVPDPVAATPTPNGESVTLNMDPKDAQEFMRQMATMSERQAMARANAVQKGRAK